jgi:hypothetical protein
LQRKARYKGRCRKCQTGIKPGDTIHHVPAAKKGKRGKTFCRTCVAKVLSERFPPAPDGKTSAWLRAREFEMAERELALTVR